MIQQNIFEVVLCLQTEHKIVKQNKITSYLPRKSRRGVPSAVFHAILMRVVVLIQFHPNQPRFKTESPLCASKNWTRVRGREKGTSDFKCAAD